MTIASTLKTAALALAIALPVAGAASAGGSYVNVEQYGYGNAAGGMQTGWYNGMIISFLWSHGLLDFFTFLVFLFTMLCRTIRSVMNVFLSWRENSFMAS